MGKVKHSKAPWTFTWDPDTGEAYNLLSGSFDPPVIIPVHGRQRLHISNLADIPVIEAAPEMAAMLRELEWACDCGYYTGVACCPCCHCREEEGHADDCRLAALLAKVMP
jgi:hypothetical protein